MTVPRVDLGNGRGVRKWATYEVKRRALVIWVKVGNWGAIPVDVDLGATLDQLGVSTADVEQAITLYRLRNEKEEEASH